METAFLWVKKHWTWITLGVIVFGALLPLWNGRFYGTGDMRDVFIPLETFFKAETQAGRIPSWHPDIAWGFPVIASAQIGYFYPPLLLTRLLPIWLYMPLNLVVHVLAMAIGMFLFLRALGRTPMAALFGSTSFFLSAFVWQHVTHFNIFLSIAWLPWQLLFIHTVARSKTITARSYALFVILLGLPFLIGQLQIPFLMAAISSLWFVYVRYQQTRQFGKPLLVILGVAIACFLLSSAQLFPTLELMTQSSRGTSGDFSIERANQHSYPLYHVPTVLFPRFFGNDHTYWGKRLEIEYGFFVGTVPLLLALWTFIFMRSKELRFWKILLGASFLLALGDLSPFRLIGLEPSLWFFSAPARWLLFATLSLSILAAFGFDAIGDRFAHIKKWVTIIASLIILGVVIGNSVLFLFPERVISLLPISSEYAHEKIESLLTSAQGSSISLTSPFTLLTLTILILIPFFLKKKNILLLITVIELLVISLTTSPVISWEQLLTPPETLTQLPNHVRNNYSRLMSIREGGDTGAYFTDPASRADTQTRKLQKELLVPALHAQFGISGIEWPASLDLSSHEKVLSILKKPDSYDLADISVAQDLNIGAVVIPKNLTQPEGIVLHSSTSAINIYALEPQSRVTFVSSNHVEKPITYTIINPSHLSLYVDAPTDGTIIVRDSFYPGWHAYIDDQEFPITPAYTIFRGIAVSPGKHTIDLLYQPKALYFGIIISTLTAAVLGITVVYTKKEGLS